MATNSKSSFFRRDGSESAPKKEATAPREYKPRAPRGDNGAPAERRGNFSKSDKPRFDSTDRPKRTYTKSDSTDRPKRSYGNSDNSDRPKRAYGSDRPERSDRPARDAKGKFAPRTDRPFNSDRPYNADRPKRSYGNSDNSDRPKRAYGSDRPERSDRPARDAKGKFAPRTDRPYNSDRPKRDDKKFDRSPRTGGVPEWVKQSAPRSKAVLHEKKEIAIEEARIERKAMEVERVMRAKRKAEQPQELTQALPKVVNTEVRLNRFIAQSGICSRREADSLIEQGFIKVNGEVIKELGVKVNPSKDSIEYEGKQLSGEKLVYIIMNKPKGYVTSVEDPHNDLTVMTILGDKVKERIYPVGRLDKQTTGVLLLTNDGELTRKLTHPSFEQRKIYHAFLDKPCTMEHLDMLAKGIELEDGEIHADEVSFVDGNKKEVGIELHSGRNRIVRRMFEHLGYRVIKLDRVFFAGFTKLGMRRGYWRYLSPKEIITLRNL